MKYLATSLFLLIVLSSGCKKESEEVLKSNHLSTKEIRNFLPESYFKESTLVYNDSLGNERSFDLILAENTQEMYLDGFEYMVDEFKISLIDSKDPYFNLFLRGSANYAPDGTLLKHLTGFLNPFNNSGSTTNIINFEDGEALIFPYNDFLPVISFNGSEYKNVYRRIGRFGSERYTSFSELNINSEMGVVAFRDKNDVLWNLIRIDSK